MPLQSALDALKNKDFTAARDLIARIDAATYGEPHFLIKGLAELALQDWDAANATFAAATERFPDHAAFWLNRGITQENLGQTDAAIASEERCLALNPAQAEAFGNLSNLYRKKKRFSEAETMARHALANGAHSGEAYNCLGLALGKQGKFKDADVALRQAQQRAPDNPDILSNRANLAVDQLHFDEAWALFAAARAMTDKAVYRHDESLARLLSGDYDLGWKLFEARLEMPNALRVKPQSPLWNGENLAGKKLLILAEQGFGDVIQFSRYQEFLLEGSLIWAVPKPLVRLLSRTLHGQVLCETAPLPDCDYYIPIMSLPLITGHLQPEKRWDSISAEDNDGDHSVSLEDQQKFLDGLVADAANDNQTSRSVSSTVSNKDKLSLFTQPTLPKGTHALKIGLVWAGSPTHERDHERSLPLATLSPIFTAVAADFYAPFTGDALSQIGSFPVTRLDHIMSDFADTAALLNQMDCIITVDTAVAHLAGILGIKTFLLLPYCPDWRWGTSGNTTPWYPSITLLRQPHHGDWENVIARLTKLIK
jgi:tetratricopeptide (TPR) repeat protein